MLTTVLILALCGVAGGYLFGRSALFEYQRDRWERKRDVLDAALYALIDDLEIQFGVMDVDTKVLPVIPTGMPVGMVRRRIAWRWRLNYALSCNVCAGWWVAGAAFAVWAGAAAVLGLPSPASWSEAPVLWGAACGLHTAITAAFNKLEVW